MVQSYGLRYTVVKPERLHLNILYFSNVGQIHRKSIYILTPMMESP